MASTSRQPGRRRTAATGASAAARGVRGGPVGWAMSHETTELIRRSERAWADTARLLADLAASVSRMESLRDGSREDLDRLDVQVRRLRAAARRSNESAGPG